MAVLARRKDIGASFWISWLYSLTPIVSSGCPKWNFKIVEGCPRTYPRTFKQYEGQDQSQWYEKGPTGRN